MILDIQRRGPAAWLWMNRPEQRNALNEDLIAALETASVLAEARAGAEAREGIRSFLEKRKPAWQ